jgi:hypothetical protein
MRGLGGTFKVLCGLLAVLHVFFLPGAGADGVCAACAPVKPKQGSCSNPNDPNCQQACQKVQASSGKAAGACSAACGKSSALNGKGAGDAADAAGNMTQNQDTPQFSQASNACKNQQNQLGRQNAAQGPQGPLQQCKTDADACKSAGGNDGGAGQMCGDAQKKLAGEAASLGDSASKLGQMCNKSDNNGEKMGQMPQMPQMPQQKGDETPQNPNENNPWENPYASNTSTGTDTTQKIETVKFDDDSNANGVSMLPGTGPSVISGNTSGPTPGYSGPSGFGSGSGHEYGANGLGINGKGNGFGPAKSGLGSGTGLGGLDSSGSSRPGDGIAGADIAPKNDGSQYEINSGGKSVLGLKGKSGEDDEVTVEQLAGAATKGDSKKPGSTDSSRALAGAGNAGALGAKGVVDGLTLFRMVKIRYTELRKIGEI